MKLQTRPSQPTQQLPAKTQTITEHPLQAGEWVHLQQRPNPYSGDEALLLCPEGDRWVVWIANYGEMRLKPDQITG